MWNCEWFANAQLELILKNETELVHVEVTEEGVLDVEVNLLEFFKGKDGEAMRWSMHCMSQQKFLEVIIRLLFCHVLSKVQDLSEEVMQDLYNNAHFLLSESVFVAEHEVILGKLLYTLLLIVPVLLIFTFVLDAIVNICGFEPFAYDLIVGLGVFFTFGVILETLVKLWWNFFWHLPIDEKAAFSV